MASVAVVTDTTHYLPRALVDTYAIDEVSLYVNWKGRTDREIDLPDFNDYYAHLATASELPTTSQPSVGDFLAVYEPHIEAGRDIVSVHISAGISGTAGSAEQAKAQLVERGVDPARVEVLDSRSTCAGLALVAMAASSAAAAGASVGDVATAAREAREAIKVWFAVDTLEFLRRGGRIGAAQAWLGSRMKVKPILTIDGEITPVERVRTSGRAFERMVEYLHERKADGCDGFVIQHIQDPERAAGLVERGREIFEAEPLFVSEIGPVIGTHVGPGLLGVAGFRSAVLDGRAG
jgi:DegV family protein with EDD domain